MKKNVLAITVLAVAMFFTDNMMAQKFPPLDKSPMDVASFPVDYKISDKIVKVTYSRPQLKGRSLESLTPAGKVWRTGANEATEITFYKDVNFGGKMVKAGTYTMATIPGATEWTVILNSARNVWGAYFYKESQDVVRVPAKVTKSTGSIEVFSIMFDKNMNLIMGWGHTIVTVPIKA